MDAAEMEYRGHMSALLDACVLQVGLGDIPEWIKEHFFCEDHLRTVTKKVGLPSKADTKLLTIAVFLDRAFSAAPRCQTDAKTLRRELDGLKSAHRNLVMRPSNFSSEAYNWLGRADQTIDEEGQISWAWTDPPVGATLKTSQGPGGVAQ